MKKLLKIVSPFNNNQDMSNAVFIVKKLLAFIGTYIVSMILAEGLVIIAHYIMGYNVLQGEMLSTQTMTLLKYYGFIIFMIVGMMYCKFIEKRSLKSMGLIRIFRRILREVSLLSFYWVHLSESSHLQEILLIMVFMTALNFR